MRIYYRIEFEWNEKNQRYKGVSLECEEYAGKIALCKGGSKGATRAAERSYALQKEMFEFQKEQLAELEAKEKGKKVMEREVLERLLTRRRTGRKATILTDFGSLGLPSLGKQELYA
ncbi:MAG: hypothetical protein Q8J68_14835 [Methanolobus sp.]|uniref:hypothetical protein n=1 Tax=Methanolobus sp. TaxID=1874737 RepID=UPI0027309155|nr:hypothetical protein [Methanolobus sp.]MDP2218551.1 hypothetical protein [Methanolobus sp.]